MMKLLTPTSNRRWNELVGVLWMAIGLLLLLSLVSFHANDPSFNAASPSRVAENWAGTVGSYGSDLLYQVLGIASLLLPLTALWIGWKWFRSRPIDSPGAKSAGAFLFLTSMMAALALVPIPLRYRPPFPAGGVLGLLMATGLHGLLNGPGSAVTLGATALVSLYLMTSFSMIRTSSWCHAHLSSHFAWAGRLRERWQAWREARAERREEMRAAKLAAKQKAKGPEIQRRTAESKIIASQPVSCPDGAIPPVKVSARSAASSTASGKPAQSPLPAEEPEILIGEREEVPLQPVIKRAAPPRNSRTYKLPSTALLEPPAAPEPHAEEELKRLAQHLVMKCGEFDVTGAVTQINPGPVVTTFEFKPEAGVKYNRITNLTEDLCLALEAESILIERIPGKSTVGIEVPNARRETIMLREILESDAFTNPHSPLTLALGKEINGRIRVADLASMPHLLIAGSTGSGKSVAMNSLIVSILFKATPDEVKMILVDPKRLELGLYDGIPHLVTPIITDPKVAANALRNGVREMERRLKLLAEKGVRNIDQYNKLFDRVENLSLFEPQSEHQRLPYIVIFIDELADLMMVDSSNVEVSITRLAQMARAVGIHLVLATQRPSVDVITGLIKANFPARISFRVATKVDSRTILDANGAEALLGKGDMLFSPPGSGRLVRVHSPLVTESEIEQVVEFWRAQAAPSYVEEFLKSPDLEDEVDEEGWEGEKDEMYEEAVRIVVEMGKASTSTLQRRLRLGYGRAARLLDIMQKDGIIGPPDGSRPREVLKRPEWIEEVEQTQIE